MRLLHEKEHTVKRRYQYRPDFFIRNDIASSKGVILSAGGGMTIEERWERETKWLVDHIKFENDCDLIIDYGCGIGRLAKVIKNPVLGVDISPTMREQSVNYVAKSTFSAVSPDVLRLLYEGGLKVSGAFAVWAFQHVLDIKETIDLLMGTLNENGVFWLMDLCKRSIPCTEVIDESFTYIDDGIDILKIIDKWCDLENIDLMTIYLNQPPSELRKYRRRT